MKIKLSFKYIAALLLTLGVSATASAQGRMTVIGVVTDENNAPMVGVGVVQKGTSNGAVTDTEGYYSITVPSNAVLEYTFISYVKQEIQVAGQKKIDVKMAPDVSMLDEVVVIGYGTVRKSDLTGAVASVGAKDIINFKTASVVDALSGQVAGVNIVATDGTPGAGYDIKIRGVGSVNGDTSPLFIVDGYEVDDIDWLANQDIQSIEVLKDASAAAIYGARGANGVVLVTTKSGVESGPMIEYNGSATYRTIAKKLELLSPYEFVKLQMENNPTKYANTYYRLGTDEEGVPYKYQTLEDYRGVKGLDWQEEGFRPTWSQNHDLSIRGGGKSNRYLFSYSHFDENGIFKSTGFVKNNFRGKFSQTVFKWLSFDVGVSYTNTERVGINTNANLLRYRNTGGLNVSDYMLRHSVYDPLAVEQSNFDPSNSNPVLQAESQTNTRRAEQWIANGSLNFTIIKGLTFKMSGSYNVNNQRQDQFFGENTNQAYRNNGVYGQSQMGKNTRWSFSNVLTYKKDFAKVHKTTFMVGHESSYNASEYVLAQAKDFPTDVLGNDNLGLGGTPSVANSGKSDVNRLSFFARAFYNYADRYMLTATIRADASSVFSEKNKWGFFPSFSAAWNIANEPFMKNADWLSTLKLRAGWGTVGNDRISSYLSLDLYSSSKYGFGTNQITVFNPKQLSNKNLRWEGSSTVNVGIDAGFLKDRIRLTVDGFIKDTKDLLLAQNLAYVTGFGSQWQNVGKIRNKGVEISLNTVNFAKKNFSWTTDFNISFIKNTLMSLQDGTKYMMSRTGFNSNYSANDYIAYVGSSLGDIYGYKFDGIYQVSDFYIDGEGVMHLNPGVADCSAHAGVPVQPGMVKYADIDHDGVITTSDRTVIGNGQPLFYGGLTNSFAFHGVDISFMLQFSYGNDIYNATRMYCCESRSERVNMFAEVADRWTVTNASNKVPSAMGYVPSELYSRFVEDGSYLRLKNLTVGYSLPDRWMRRIHLRQIRIYATMQNLFCISSYSGYDPEVNTLTSPLMPGFDWSSYPKNRSYTFGVELKF